MATKSRSICAGNVVDTVPIAINDRVQLDDVHTAGVRYGKFGVVYMESGTINRGAFGSVLRVKDVLNVTIFAAMEPYYRSSEGASGAVQRRESLTAK